jgi:alpha-galactosidase
MSKTISTPRINVPAKLGVRPGNAFFLTLPIEGHELNLHCTGLPPGVSFNNSNASLSGKIDMPGCWELTLHAENSAGYSERKVQLIAGKEIQLTPPMGWNSWYCFSESVSDLRIRETALAMKERGLSCHGWNHINIDDCWQGVRGGKYGALQGNERFPDMKGLADYIHSLGLRFGIYSTPWISSYAGFRGGSTDGGFEERFFLPENERLQPNQVFGRCPRILDVNMTRVGAEWFFDHDVRQWAEWEVDFVKVDWKPNDVPVTRRIHRELYNCGRDITLSLSNNAPPEFAPELAEASELWRVTGDIRDTWESINEIGFKHHPIWLKELRPGHYPDFDMLQIGDIGVPNRPNLTYTPSRLSLNEQRLQFSLWCLLSAPLILSCDIAGMDDQTFALLTNDEIIAINQDPLVQAPDIEDCGNGILIYRKALANGSLAIGIFNRADSKNSWRVDTDKFEVWDLWEKDVIDLRKDITLEPHSVRMFKTR